MAYEQVFHRPLAAYPPPRTRAPRRAPPRRRLGYAAGAARYEWELQGIHGPRIAALYTGDAARKKTSRHLQAMEQAGLVELHRSSGVNVTHVKLTAEGLATIKPTFPGPG